VVGVGVGVGSPESDDDGVVMLGVSPKFGVRPPEVGVSPVLKVGVIPGDFKPDNPGDFAPMPTGDGVGAGIPCGAASCASLEGMALDA